MARKKTFYSIYLLIPHPLSKVETLEIIKKKDGNENNGRLKKIRS